MHLVNADNANRYGLIYKLYEILLKVHYFLLFRQAWEEYCKRGIFSAVSYNNADGARSVDRDLAIGRWTGCHEGGEAGREVRTAAGEKQTSAGVWAEYDGIRGRMVCGTSRSCNNSFPIEKLTSKRESVKMYSTKGAYYEAEIRQNSGNVLRADDQYRDDDRFGDLCAGGHELCDGGTGRVAGDLSGGHRGGVHGIIFCGAGDGHTEGGRRLRLCEGGDRKQYRGLYLRLGILAWICDVVRSVCAGLRQFYQLYLSVYPADGGGLSARGLCHVHEYQGDEKFRDAAECDHDAPDRAACTVCYCRSFSYRYGEPDAVHAAGNVGRVQRDGLSVYDLYRIWADHDGERGGHRPGEDDPEGDPDLDRGGYRDQDVGVFHRLRDHSMAGAGAGGHEHADDRHGGTYRRDNWRLSLCLCWDPRYALLDQHGGHGVLEDFFCDGAGSAAAKSVQGDQQDDEDSSLFDRHLLGHRVYRSDDQGSGAHLDSDQYLLADRVQSRQCGADHFSQENAGA